MKHWAPGVLTVIPYGDLVSRNNYPNERSGTLGLLSLIFCAGLVPPLHAGDDDHDDVYSEYDISIEESVNEEKPDVGDQLSDDTEFISPRPDSAKNATTNESSVPGAPGAEPEPQARRSAPPPPKILTPGLARGVPTLAAPPPSPASPLGSPPRRPQQEAKNSVSASALPRR